MSGFLSKMKLSRANFELFPLAFFVGATCIMSSVFSVYALFTKSDVVAYRNLKPRPWEVINPNQKQKLISFNQTYKEIPAVEALKKEMGER